MPAYFNQVIVNWRDQKGGTATSFMSTQDQTAGGASAYNALAAAFANTADALVQCIQFQQTIVFGGTPSAGAYSTCVDRGVLLGNIPATNAPYRISIVGPKEAIFQANNSLIDLANPQILALESACVAVLGDSLGNPLGPFKKGIRTMARGN